MSENPKPTGADEVEVIRQPVIPIVEEADDGTRSVTKDRDPKETVTVETENEPVVVRKPIVIKTQPEE